MKYNFIRTQDKDTFKLLKDQGFQLIDDKNGFFTFVNDKTLKFDEGVDVSKVQYTNMLCI